MGGRVPLNGKLGHPIGTDLTIEGKRTHENNFVKGGKDRILMVSKVNGEQGHSHWLRCLSDHLGYWWRCGISGALAGAVGLGSALTKRQRQTSEREVDVQSGQGRSWCNSILSLMLPVEGRSVPQQATS